MYVLKPSLTTSNLEKYLNPQLPGPLENFPDNLCELRYYICLLTLHLQMHYKDVPQMITTGSLFNPWGRKGFLCLPLFLTFLDCCMIEAFSSSLLIQCHWCKTK